MGRGIVIYKQAKLKQVGQRVDKRARDAIKGKGLWLSVTCILKEGSTTAVLG